MSLLNMCAPGNLGQFTCCTLENLATRCFCLLTKEQLILKNAADRLQVDSEHVYAHVYWASKMMLSLIIFNTILFFCTTSCNLNAGLCM